MNKVREGSFTPGSLDKEYLVVERYGAGTYVFSISLENLASGDTVIINVKKRVKTGGVYGKIAGGVYDGDTKIHTMVDTIPITISEGQGIRITLEQTDGTARSYPWHLSTTGAVAAETSTTTTTTTSTTTTT